jgi:hypothetical protein
MYGRKVKEKKARARVKEDGGRKYSQQRQEQVNAKVKKGRNE